MVLELITEYLVTVRSVVVARLCFHRHLWFCSQGGGRHPPGRHHPWPVHAGIHTHICPLHAAIHTPFIVYAGIHTPLSSACWDTPPSTLHAGIRSTIGRYASYWNAYLFFFMFSLNVVGDTFALTFDQSERTLRLKRSKVLLMKILTLTQRRCIHCLYTLS